MQTLAELFREPGTAYRGKPFWSWNGDLEKDELLRQIEVMQEMGMGGFFMHSRTGLITEYLGEKWFELTNACAAEAEKRGLEAWLYDEDRWPSGTAGGLVTQNPQFRSRFMSLRPVPGSEFLWNDDLFAAFSCELEGLAFSNCERITPDTPHASYADKTILAFSIEAMQESSFYNGFTYVDTMQRAATDEYIRLTHEAYKQHCGEHLSRSIKGIFTDEPHRGPVMAGFGVSNANRLWMAPWTPELFERFEEQFGTDLVERLPALFLWPEGQTICAVKWQYMELTQQLFLDNYAKPLFDWCQNNDLLLTGHVLHEDTLTSQATMQGALMRFYEYMHFPGIDILAESNRSYWAAKQLSSVARQLGQKWLLSELYGCTGWQMSFESHKAVGDWQALFGINVRCHHLSWYTMEGEAKRDYPASIFYQSAWWREYHHVETYYARLGALLSHGEPCCDVLVINPIESLWCQIHAGWVQGLSPQDEAVRLIEQGYQELFFWLVGAHIDFDYGDEEMMSRLCKIERDESGTPSLRVGQAAYRTIVVGRMTTIRATTLQLLDEFASAGGQVIFVGEPPAYVDASSSDHALQLAARAAALPWEELPLVAACQKNLRNRVDILDAEMGQPLGEVFCQLRDDGERKILVAMNINSKKAFAHAHIRLHGVSSPTVSEWNCLSGDRYAIPTQVGEGFIEWQTDFPASGERVFVVDPQKQQLPVLEKLVEVKRAVCKGPFAFSLKEPNVCVLDMARFRIEEGEWQTEKEVLQVDRAVRHAFDLPFRSGDMVQPWFRNRTQPEIKHHGCVRLAFEFFVDDLPEGPIQVALERPEIVALRLNGHRVESTPDGWWVDNAFHLVNVPIHFLIEGANVLEWEVDFHEGINIEALYLLGNFGVRVEGTRKTLSRLPETLKVGDVTGQGLPFYGGAINYHVPVVLRPGATQKAFLELTEWEAACAKVNGPDGEEQLIAWQPYRADVTTIARDSGVIDLEVILTRRNTFGPLHQIPLRAGAYGPANFITEGATFSTDYMLYPSGLLSEPELWLATVEGA
ncbi:hypothetical protein IAD21_06340 [Abditibacteriota bacterium]|nr:hypothetical protein IAD21_06340 [Abditibacteriota bacterium]